MRRTRHGQIHANLGALAGEVLAQTLLNLFGSVLRNADYMLGGPGLFLGHLLELGAGSLANGAELGSLGTFVHVTANLANPLHTSLPPYFTIVIFCLRFSWGRPFLHLASA